jgi:hypothetical protein
MWMTGVHMQSHICFIQCCRYVVELLLVPALVRQAYVDEPCALALPHLLQPMLSLLNEVIAGLEEEANKKKSKSTESGSSQTYLFSHWIQRIRPSGSINDRNAASSLLVASQSMPQRPPASIRLLSECEDK